MNVVYLVNFDRFGGNLLFLKIACLFLSHLEFFSSVKLNSQIDFVVKHFSS
jgi:hypothetical protein